MEQQASTIEERVSDAINEVDAYLRAGMPVANAISAAATQYSLPLDVVRSRGERQFGSLAARKRWHAKKDRASNDVREFLADYEFNSDWWTLGNIERDYASFLSAKYKRKVTEQDRIWAEEVLQRAYDQDFGRREADRKARGVRLVRSW